MSFIHKYLDKHLKGSNHIDDPDFREKVALIETINSILVNLAVFAVKLVLGLMSNSIAVIADAFNSFGDMFTSIIAMIGFRLAKAPPDEKHPYGHSRIEFIVAVILAMILLFTGIQLILVSWQRILKTPQMTITNVLLIVMVLSIFAKEYLARVSRSLGKYINSNVLIANFWNYRFDSISTLIIIVGLIFAKFGIYSVDGYLGIVAALFIIFSGIQVLIETSNDIIGKAPSDKLISEIRKIALHKKEVIGCHDIIVHDYGSIKSISLHIEMDEILAFMDAHNIGEDIEEELCEKCHAKSVVVHIDPVTKLTGKYSSLNKEIGAFIKDHKNLASFHDLRKIGQKVIMFDLVFAKNVSDNIQRGNETELLKYLNGLYPEIVFRINIEPEFTY
jgi:cation diffusion facilitator family transporter